MKAVFFCQKKQITRKPTGKLVGLPTRMTNPYDPDLSNLKKSDFEQVYEPAEDTWLFVDALELEKEFLTKNLHPTFCFEIGVLY